MRIREVLLLAALFGVFAACSDEAPSAPAATGNPVQDKPLRETACADGVDEDGDGKTDCDDRDCAPTTGCQIARCQQVCADIFECEGITSACTEKERVGVLKGCQASCSNADTRSQVSMADGAPCFVIEGAFLEQVQKSGLCMGGKSAGSGEESS